jgi:hypothetical protein
MGMQHSTAALHINAKTALGGQPKTRALLKPVPDDADIFAALRSALALPSASVGAFKSA